MELILRRCLAAVSLRSDVRDGESIIIVITVEEEAIAVVVGKGTGCGGYSP